MKIVERISDGAIVMIAECSNAPQPPEDYIVHDVPGWDWSKANLTGVDKSDPAWLFTQLAWNGSTVVKKT